MALTTFFNTLGVALKRPKPESFNGRMRHRQRFWRRDGPNVYTCALHVFLATCRRVPYNRPGFKKLVAGLCTAGGKMAEQQVTIETLSEIRRFVRQIWVMVLILVILVAVPMICLGCSVIGLIGIEFLPH